MRIFSIQLFVLLMVAGQALAEVSFQNDVMAVLSKAGCNAGACHGNKTGKGGFKLSLRGQDAADDHLVLTRDLSGRRVDAINPDQSLILLKATTQLPHEGGLRFRKDSREYRVIREWIEGGATLDSGAPKLVGLEVSPKEEYLRMPRETAQIRAVASFSDGSVRDVTSLACYEQSVVMADISPEGLVQRQKDGETTVIVRYLNLQRPVRLAFVPNREGFKYTPPPTSNYVDRHVYMKLCRMGMNPSAPANDGEFLRRAYLDLIGTIPTAEEAQAFVADTSPGKREKIVDALLERSEFADFWALKWADLLKLEERALDRKGAKAFHRWIRDSIAANKPIDQFARELITARGSTYENPAANYWRANRDPITRGESTAQVFLGTRLNCAQCHNHPFDRWTQEDYYGWADVFSRIDYRILDNRRRDDNDKHEFVGEQIVFAKASGHVTDPRTGKAAQTRVLGNESVAFSEEEDRLGTLAEWMTSKDNALFAKVQVNRIWYHLMGRGIVDPIDDFRATNPPSHPELLDELAQEFVESGFDMRRMIRRIMSSQTYALSAEPNDTNRDDEVNYSHVIPRRLTAEQLLDTLHQVTGVPGRFNGFPEGTRAISLPGVEVFRPRERRPGAGDMFLKQFGRPPRLLACECERSTDTSMGQVFQLISGSQITQLLADKENRLGRLIEAGKSDREAVEELYWTALTRGPSQEELDRTVSHLANSTDRRKGLEDVAWALLNAKEFVLRK